MNIILSIFWLTRLSSDAEGSLFLRVLIAMRTFLKTVLNFEWLLWININAAKSIFLVLYVFIGVLVWLLPKDYIYEGIENPKWWHNLKLWATGVLAMIFITYLIF